MFDVQDIGARFYTYTSTMGLAMEAAAEAGKEFVVLDRPNPIGGDDHRRARCWTKAKSRSSGIIALPCGTG